MDDHPFEPEEGQESEPPDRLLALAVAVGLLGELANYLQEREPELRHRCLAVRVVLHRVREGLADADER